MKKLKITKEQRFKIHIEEQISEDSLFLHEYEMAVNCLNNIWNAQRNISEKTKKIENPNNIIAFCGDRGSGKSSVMMSFVQAVVYSGNRKDILKFENNLRDNNWETYIMVDPSMFDGVHNIIDIVLAHIYQDFHDLYCGNNQSIEQYEREKMMMQLSKVYKSLSIINNKEKMLDDEYDEAGNIAKIQKLGVSTMLKKDMGKLIELYLELVSKQKNGRKCEKLLIAIDDLDLCNENAYQMAEQIRKYLILPNIIIVMAVKIEQLEMGIEEKNRGDFKNIIQGKGRINSIDKEMREMAERYVTKLIPKARRIYLPELRSNQVELEGIIFAEEEKKNIPSLLENTIIKLMWKKTGMYFVPSNNGFSYLLPRNLRDLINFISLLDEMEDPGEDMQIKRNNILEFKFYFIEEMIKRNVKWEELNAFMEVVESDDQIKNFNMNNFLKQILVNKGFNVDIYVNSSMKFASCSLATMVESLANYLNYMTLNEDNLLSHYIRVYYTIILNERFAEKIEVNGFLIGGFIWGNRLNGVMPWIAGDNYQFLMYRERFSIHIFECWNAIADVLEEKKYLPPVERKDVSRRKVTRINKENEQSEVIIWILMGLLSSNYAKVNNWEIHMNKFPIIANNYDIPPNVTVSLEDYIVNLCELEHLYDFLCLELMGVTRDDVYELFSAMKEKNVELIKQAGVIVLNVDLSLRLLEYCAANNDYKKATESDEDRTYQLVKKFLDNVSNYMEGAGMERTDWTKLWIPLEKAEDGEIRGEEIDICRVYARICTMKEEESRNPSVTDMKEKEKQKLKQNFAQKIERVAMEDYFGKTKDITGSIMEKNRNARYVKDLLENIANHIQKYSYKEKKMPEGFHSELIQKLYSEVIDLYMQNPDKEISGEQYNEYKMIAQVRNVIK